MFDTLFLAQYLTDMAKREKLLKRHIMTLRAFNGEEGARFGESLLKSISQSDSGISKLLSLVDHTSRVERSCESHWRAGAYVKLSQAQLTETKLRLTETKLKELELESLRDRARIEDLESRLNRSIPVVAAAEAAPLSNLRTVNETSSTHPEAQPILHRKPSLASHLVQTPALNVRRRPAMPRLQVVSNAPRVMSVIDTTESSSSTIPVDRLGSTSTRPALLNPARPFERPREPPPVPNSSASECEASAHAFPFASQKPLPHPSPVKRSVPLPISARSLLSTNARRTPVPITSLGSDRPIGQFATWSPPHLSRRHMPLNSLFTPPPPPPPQDIVQEKVLVSRTRASHEPEIGPQAPPSQCHLTSLPPLPGCDPLPHPSLNRHAHQNLTSITLSQLGALDLASLINHLSLTPSPSQSEFPTALNS